MENPPPVDSLSPNVYLPLWHQRLTSPHQITIFMLESNKSNKTCISNCSRSSTINFYFIFILFVHTGQGNFDFNWCSVLTECCCYPWKSSNGKIHSSSDSYHSIKKYPPAKFLTSYHPYPLTVFGKLCCSFCCLVLFCGCVIAPHVMCFSTEWYYGSAHVEPWYHITRLTLLCVLCNKASSLLRSDT